MVAAIKTFLLKEWQSIEVNAKLLRFDISRFMGMHVCGGSSGSQKLAILFRCYFLLSATVAHHLEALNGNN